MDERLEPTQRRYWRSLQRLYESPAFGGEEFPAGASRGPDAFDRRSMLKLMGASMALAGAVSCRRPEEQIVPLVEGSEGTPGLSSHFASTVTLEEHAFGVVVESHEGRPTKVEGNPLHPASRGAATAWMQASLLDLYDPDRLQSPLRKQKESWENTGWQAFLDEWIGMSLPYINSGGEGLAVLAESHCSPTLGRLQGQFLSRFPKALWAHGAAADDSVVEAVRRATGAAGRPVYDLSRARVVLSVDSDLLHGDLEALRHSAGWAAARRPEAGLEALRLYSVESDYSLTGAAADHRLALRSSRMHPFLAALAAALGSHGRPVDGAASDAPAPDGTAAVVDHLAARLAAAGGWSLVSVGEQHGPELHELALRINQALGAVGRTVTLVEAPAGGCSTDEERQVLVDAMAAGAVSALVVLGGNPLYSTSPEAGLAEALARVQTVVQLADRLNETAAASDWVLPAAHWLESWGDARSVDGAVSVAQPLIRPLFGGRTPIELVALLLEERHEDGYELVRRTWQQQILSDVDFETHWERTLHDGVAAVELAPALLEVQAPAAPLDSASPPGEPLSANTVEVVIRRSATLHDGRFANNAWLQELPDPVTRIVWGNVAAISPATAAKLGLDDGQVVQLTRGQRQIEIAVWRLPGHANEALTLVRGYGRSAAGRVGNGRGADVGPLRAVAAGPQTVQLTGLDRRQTIVQTQEHGSMEGRTLIRELAGPDDVLPPAPAPAPDLWPPHPYGGDYQWGMTIDLDACTGCQACVIACQSENNVPVVGPEQVERGREMHWLRVDRYFEGDPAAPRMLFQPVPCMHCENAPCEQVCPVAATVHDSEGLNVMVYNRCIGTRYCSNNCPYKVRHFNFFHFTHGRGELMSMAMNPDVTVRSRGVMEKCTYCVQRLVEAKSTARRQDRLVADGEVQTACQQTCPTEAISFGNLVDPDSAVRRAKASARNYELLEELNHRPRTSYLARVRRPAPGWPAEKER